MEFFSRIENPTVNLESQRTQIGKTILERRAKLEASDFRTYFKGTMTKRVQFWHKACA